MTIDNTYIRLILALIPILSMWGCTHDMDEENIYCDAEIALVLPDNAVMEILIPDNSLDGTFFRNINTLMGYTIPVFANNRTTMRVQKGVYIVAFEGEAIMDDGTVRQVRVADYSVTRNAIYLMGDYESISLTVSYIDL